ncbi:35366_t:CDS:2, partial [Gigaspora margarita]
MESIYNYVVTTDTRKEYLINLKNYSAQSYTDRFAAIVADAASNCRVACQKIQDLYPYILNVRCAVYVINLIATDLVKLDNIKRLINNCRKIKNFFKDSYLSYSLLTQEFTNIKIKSGKGLKDNGFHDAALTALELWQNLGHTRLESEELIAQMRHFEAKVPPFDLSYVLDAYNISSVGNIIRYEEADQVEISEIVSLDNVASSSSTLLLIEEIINLEVENLESSVKMTPMVFSADLDYDPQEVLNNFLERESQ